jgi:hypothetical protein
MLTFRVSFLLVIYLLRSLAFRVLYDVRGHGVCGQACGYLSWIIFEFWLIDVSYKMRSAVGVTLAPLKYFFHKKMPECVWAYTFRDERGEQIIKLSTFTHNFWWFVHLVRQSRISNDDFFHWLNHTPRQQADRLVIVKLCSLSHGLRVIFTSHEDLVALILFSYFTQAMQSAYTIHMPTCCLEDKVTFLITFTMEHSRFCE